MDSIVPGYIRRLLSEHSFEVDPNCSSEDLSCTMCHKLMVDAYQTYCGCKYCRECVVSYMDGGGQYCRGGKTECQEEVMVMDANFSRASAINRSILMLKVCCPYKPCQFVAILKRMEDHMGECAQRPIECPFTVMECRAESAAKELIESHLRDESLRHCQMLVGAVGTLRAEVAGLQAELAIVRLKEVRVVEEQLDRERRARSEDAEVFAGLVEALRVQMVATTAEMLGQMEARSAGVAALEAALAEERRSRVEEGAWLATLVGELRAEVVAVVGRVDARSGDWAGLGARDERHEARLAALEAHVSALAVPRTVEDAVASLRKAVQTVWTDVVAVRAEATRHSGDSGGRLAALEARISEGLKTAATAARVDELARMVQGLDTGTNRVVPVGRLSVTVDGITGRMVRTGESIDSPHLYSHANGYKLRLHVCPGGDGEGLGTHMSVFAVICRGEYDAVLQWPCMHPITVSILNQRTREIHQAELIKYSRSMKAFHRPLEGDNPPRGSCKFISHADVLSVDDLMVDDAVILQIAVGTPP